MTNRLVAVVSALCAVWVLLYMLLAGLDPWRSFYAQTALLLLSDPKDGVPVLHLGLPILLAGTLATLFWKLPTRTTSSSRLPLTSATRRLPTWIHRWIHRLRFVEGDWNLDLWAMCAILVPSMIFVTMTIYRHMHGNELDLDDQLLITSNSFGMVSEVVGSFLLIPVARHSSLLKIVGWSPARAVRLHVWAGRIFILAVLVHGGMHIFRWMGLSNERLITMILPPAPCWTWDNDQYTSYQPTCVDESSDCSCYDLFRNLTGFGSGVALLILLVTSLQEVRRKCYRLFYVSHIIAAPLAIILLVLHWNRSILYFAPCLLYYAASSLPVFVESCLQRKSNQGVKVVSVEHIPPASNMKKEYDNTDAHYMSLTVEATQVAVQRFRPGYYVQLLAPEVSSISHPFTVNTVPGQNDQLRIIFKVLGKFTTDLSTRIEQATLEQTSTTDANKMPQVFVDGYLGTPNRVEEVLRHDVAVMIAGGIGITPYLSLIHQVHDVLSRATSNAYPTKRIVLVWICRDSSLVDYVRREYMQPLLDAQEANQTKFKVKFVIYHTGDSTPFVPMYSDEEASKSIDNDQNEVQSSTGGPFAPSRFAVGLSSTLKTNALGFLAFSAIAWVGLASVWWLYVHVQDIKGVSMRVCGIVAICLVGVVAALLVNLLAGLTCFQTEGTLDENDIKSLDSPPLCNSWSSFGVEMESVPSIQVDMENGLVLCEQDEDGCEATNKVTLEEKLGRPTVHQMMKYVDSARHPGLFTCGPLPMMRDIRDHTEERCMLRLDQCRRDTSHHIALYEESFAM